jgi:hypothetical protein
MRQTETNQTTLPEARLDEALAEYMQRSDLGESVDRSAFLQKYPDIRVELSAFFRVADQLADVQLGQLLEGRKPRSLSETLAAAAPAAAPSPAKVSAASPAAVSPAKAGAQTPAKSPSSESAAKSCSETEESSRKSRKGVALSLRQRLQAMPALMVSFLLHCIALIVLGSITLTFPALELVVPILVAQNDAETPEIQAIAKIDLPQSETESVEAVEATGMSEGVDISSLDDSASSLRTELVSSSSLQTMSMETLVRTPGKGDGLGKAGMGKVKFFGQSTSGQRFVFVIDNSGSMTKGRFETALYELHMAVEQMQPNQMFYVIFFSDTAYSLFHPEPVPTFVPATSPNKYKLGLWLKTVETNLRTDALEAMQKALALRPDVIYLLGDGAFTDKTSDFMSKLPSGPQIHVLGMEVSPKHAEAFKEIAVKFKGTYKDVGIRPEMAAVAKADPRPFNKKRGTVWGLKLPP